ncbi:heme/hemin ABC transporter substrate-binding protein [Ferrimonas balearica]|uniref:heme/hemin ABC transporter substrate-binding protein n=1 Tax=Ferrimonas balearica TaxID=44012 RepID=UPI001C574D6A|nr:ABC transporter substrate-binding protein [Ferrimonas balearica]MBW3164104.1 ABC transporter substrate-binding protein [Ferrimonas balearica]
MIRSLFLLAALTLPAHAAERVVSVNAALTEIVVALEAADQLVAVDVSSTLADPQLPRLGYHRQLSAEGILAMNPDQVLAGDTAGPASTLDTLRQADIPVLVMTNPQTGEALKAHIRELAKVLEREPQGEALVNKVSQQLDGLSRQSAATRAKPQVLFLMSSSQRGLRIGGKGTPADTLLTLAGAENLADFEGYRSITAEGILALAPQALLTMQMPGEAVPDLVEQHPLLAHLPGAARVYALPAESMIGGLSLGGLDTAQDLQEWLDTQGLNALAMEAAGE